MPQRLLLTACLATTGLCLALLVLLSFQSNRATSAVAQSNDRLADVIARTSAVSKAQTGELLTLTQAIHKETLDQLQAILKAAQSQQSPYWVPVSFKLVQEKPDGPPAPGCAVVLGKGLHGASAEVLRSGALDVGDKLIRRQSDPDGLVDFGAVRPGDWDFAISMSCNDQHSWKCEGTINVLPGTKVSKTIICPKTSLDRAAAELRVQWPTVLTDKNPGVLATFVREPTVFQPPLEWRLMNSAGSEHLTKVLLGPRNYQDVVGDGIEIELWAGSDDPDANREVNRVFADVHSLADSSRPKKGILPLGSYAIQQLIVMAPCGPEDTPASGARFELLGYAMETPERPFSAVAALPNDPLSQTSMSRIRSSDFAIEVYKDPIVVTPQYWHSLRGRFEMRPNQVNEWKIPLPDVVAAFLHEKFLAQAPAGDDRKDRGLDTKVSISP
jgi:hypothetical protein